MELFYRKFGEGHPMIIAHGLYGSSDNWVTIGKVLSEYFEVYLIDQRNHGRSPHSNEHNYDVMKADFIEFMDKHAIEKAVLLGHSMGGKTVMNVAVAHPERVSRLIVVDIAPKTYIRKIDYSFRSINHDKIITSLLKIDLKKAESREDIDKELSKSIIDARLRQFLLKNVQRSKDNLFEWNVNLHVLYDNFETILGGFDYSRFENGRGVTGFPALFVRGANSDYIVDEDIAGIKTVFPHAEVVTIPNAGHWLHAEQPELFIKKVKEFVFGA